MVRITRRHNKKNKHQSSKKGIFTIPELRRSFEHIESFVDEKIKLNISKEQLIKDLQKEWAKVFFKDLDKKSAEAFIINKLSKNKSGYRKTAKKYKGGGILPLSGSPNDYVTRQGIYLSPGQIPNTQGHLEGGVSNFGSYVQYVDKGFWNPEPAKSYDPVEGQTRYPTSVPVGMGDNTVIRGGGNKKRHSRRAGGGVGSLLSQAFMHPISSSSPSGNLQNMQDLWYGKNVGSSPDQVQRNIDYKIGSVYPKPITFN